MIRLRLFGSVDLKRSDDSDLRSILAQAKPLGVLAYLASATPVGYRRREELLSIFWPELDSAHGRRALSQALHVLRGELEEGAIKTRGAEDISLDPGVVSSDVQDFRSAIARQDWSTAAELYRGELLSGFLITGSPEFDQWLEKERSRLRSQTVDAAWHLSSAAELSGNKPVSQRWARRAVELDQYDEDHIRRLMSLLDRSGNRSEAIKVYEEFRARVTRDLELEPSRETRALAESLRETIHLPLAARRDTTDAPSQNMPQVVAEAVPQKPRSSNRRVAISAVSLTAVVVLAAFIYVRNSGADSRVATISPTSQVVIAEFQSAPADTALGRTVTEALRLDLSRSHLIRVVSDATIRDALGLMRRDTMLRMTPELAREIAIRESAKGFLTGEIRRAGAGFALSARLVSADNGELISGWRANASDSTKLLAAIDQLSASVRHDAGESMKAISESSPLLRVSTTSLSALRKHAMGTRAFYAEDHGRAAQLFEEAVAEDSTFSDAYMMLSTVLSNSSTHPSRAIEAAIKAYQYRDKLRDAERYNVTSHYLWIVKGDIPGTIAASNNAAALDPSIVFWGRMSSLLTQQRKYREGELAALRGLQWEKNPFLYGFLAGARYRAGRADEARRTIAYGLREFPNSVVLLALRIEMTEALGDYERADSLAHSAPRANNEFPLQQQAFIDAILGRIDEARQHLADVRRAQEATGGISAVNTSLLLARLELDLARDTSRALRIADSIPSSTAWLRLYARERPYVSLAHFYVLAGRVDRARELLTSFEREVPADFRARALRLSSRTRSMLRVAAGDRAAADEIKAAVADDPQPLSALADLVWAYQRTGARENAARDARAYLDEVSPRRMEQDAFYLSRMRELTKTTGTPGVRK